MDDYINLNSKFYCLEPIALGTDYSECLTSFIERLAKEHNVLTGTLLNMELVPLLKKDYLTNYSLNGGNGFYDWAYSLNGTQKNAIDFTKAIELLTCRNDIHLLSLVNWREVLPVRGLIRDTIAWCPLCFEEWREKKKELYLPLFWVLKVVDTCNRHKVKLQNICVFCNNKISMLHRSGVVGYCPRCKSWLGMSCGKVYDFKYEGDYVLSEWINQNIAELIICTPKLKKIPLRKDLINKIQKLIENEAEGITHLSKSIGISKTTVWEWSKGNTIPSIDKLLLLGYVFSMTLVEMFTNTEIKSKNNFTEQPNIKCKKSIYKRNRLSKDELKIELEKYLEEKDPTSMVKVAESIGINKRILYRHFPEICKHSCN